jgi:GH24 family phage-related lysozyme (muramidase)
MQARLPAGLGDREDAERAFTAWAKALNRDEFRRLCDRRKTGSKLLRELGRQTTR